MKKRLIFIPVLLLLIATFLFLLTQKQNESQTVISDSEAVNTQTEQAGTEEAASIAEVSASEGENDTTEPGADLQEEKPREQPFLVQITDSDPSIAYVLVRMPDPIGLLPLPTEGEYTRMISQTMADGSEAINVLHLTPNGFRMEDANCEGHDCVMQGEVTLENREERILWNMIICLPHQLSLELITREEAISLLR